MCLGLGDVPDLEPLTDRQRQILWLIRVHVRDERRVPTYRQLGAMLGVRSSATVHEHVSNLVKAGYLALERPRAGVASIRLVEL